MRTSFAAAAALLAALTSADSTITYSTPEIGVEGSCNGAGGSSTVMTALYECLLFRNGNFEGPVPCDGEPIITASNAGDVFGFRACGMCGGDISVTGQCTQGQMGLEDQITVGQPAAGATVIVVDDGGGDPPPPPPPPAECDNITVLCECNDLLDNDGDGTADYQDNFSIRMRADPQCNGDPLDNDESQ